MADKAPTPKFRVTNPTNKSQALQAHGQMLACVARRSIVVMATWDDEAIEALKAKGLKVAKVGDDTKTGYDPLPTADDAMKAARAKAKDKSAPKKDAKAD